MAWDDDLDSSDLPDTFGHEGWEELPGWVQTHQGLNLYYRGLLWMVVAVVGLAVTGFVAAAIGLETVSRVVWAGIPFVGMAVQVVIIVGIVKFTAVPEQSGARTLAWIALIGMGIGVIVTLIDFIGSLDELFEAPRRRYYGRRPPDPPSTLEQVGTLASSIGFVCLVVACRRVAGFIGSITIRSALTVVLVLLSLFAVWVLAVLVEPKVAAYFVAEVAVLVGVVVASLVFLFNVGALRDAIFVGVEATDETDVVVP